ncbi:MAG: sel1 repeat family protein [Deltaproteobacteria bacterium]|nr:sel1 repeat family protein [Deltaproteobacteria bacterium]
MLAYKKKEILKNAREGNARAQLEAALSYIWGKNGFPVNERQARIWYKKASLSGNPEAMFNLGTMYLNGEGGVTDVATGIKWLKTSAASKKKHIYRAVAPQLLSEIYRCGLHGISVDSNEAAHWKTIAEKRKEKSG